MAQVGIEKVLQKDWESWPHVMAPNADGQPGILKDMVLWAEDSWWLKPRYLRRGRLVEDACSMVALGHKIPDEWWSGHSGERDDDRVDHEELRPFVNGVRQFLAEHDFVLEQKQLLVVNEAERYCGRLDWKGFMRSAGIDGGLPPPRGIIDQKNGPPPPEFVTVNGVRKRNRLYEAYKMQRALYLMAYQSMRQHDEPNLPSWTAGLHLFDGTYKFVVDKPSEAAHWRNKALLAVRGYRIRYGDL